MPADPRHTYSEHDGYEGPDRRQPTGLDFSNMPLWVKAVSLLGFPIFVALFFMGQTAGFVPSPAARIEPALHETNMRIDQLRTALEAQIVQQRVTSERNSRLLASICRNAAKTEYQMTGCD